jgi:hypothetical protein
MANSIKFWIDEKLLLRGSRIRKAILSVKEILTGNFVTEI